MTADLTLRFFIYIYIHIFALLFFSFFDQNNPVVAELFFFCARLNDYSQ